LLTDARALDDGSEIRADVCVVGAGPAGITIARALADAPLDVCLMESGGFEPELWTQRLYRGEIAGRPYFGLDRCRFRLFGGTSNRWGGWCRPLEPLDFEARSWVPLSGWPFGIQAVVPYHQRASQLLGLNTSEFSTRHWRAIAPEPGIRLPEGTFENQVFQYSPETNFGQEHREALVDAPRVRTLLHANAVELELAVGGRSLRRVRAMTRHGRVISVAARAFVLAAGGIENPRLLLASNSQRPKGIGNEHDWVGRCFMEHPHAPLAHFVPASPAARRDFYRKHIYGRHRIRGVLAPSAKLQRAAGLLGCSIAVEAPYFTFGTPFLEWPPELTFGMRRAAHWVDNTIAWLASDAAQFLYGLPRRWSALAQARRVARQGARFRAHPTAYPLYLRAEQRPNPRSRVVLSARRDALGSPQARLEWHLSAEDTESLWRNATELKAAIEAAGIGRVVLPEGVERERWRERIIGAPHHIGTTRMSADSKLGVVDEHCRVHSVENLFVAGSSVFPTAGYANPMFTIISLALRLADRLCAVYA
jgi:choline dehydrogenase-like flavoprotein